MLMIKCPSSISVAMLLINRQARYVFQDDQKTTLLISEIQAFTISLN